VAEAVVVWAKNKKTKIKKTKTKKQKQKTIFFYSLRIIPKNKYK